MYQLSAFVRQVNEARMARACIGYGGKEDTDFNLCNGDIAGMCV